MDNSKLEADARDFLVGAFEALRDDRVIPTSRFQPFIRVGREYFGDAIRGVAHYSELEAALEQAYPGRFASPKERRNPEFASTYIFSLLEAAVARCAKDQDYSRDSAGVSASVAELITVLESETYEVVCCRAVSHLGTTGDEPLELGQITVLPEPSGFHGMEKLVAAEIPGAVGIFSREEVFAYDPLPLLAGGQGPHRRR